MDCGCFGEAIHLTHMQTFIKNLILLALIMAYMPPLEQPGEVPRKKYVSFSLIAVSTVAFTVYSWKYIPLIDFTAYKPGAELVAGATIDPNEMFETTFTYEKDGERETFRLENLPDSTWTFISADTRRKDTAERNLVELSFYQPQTGAYMDTLATKGKVMVVSVYDTDMKAGKWEDIKKFMRRSDTAGFTTLLLCSRTEGIPSSLEDKAFISDYKTLISMNRSNGGVTYFSDGILIRKWARIDAPDTDELKETYNTASTEVSIGAESKGNLGFQGFLLYVFAVMLLL
jgi:triosephosphate isomerase